MSNPIHRANLLYRLPQFFIAQKRVKTRSKSTGMPKLVVGTLVRKTKY